MSALAVRAAVATTTASPRCMHARPVGAWRLRPRPPGASASPRHGAWWGGRVGEQGHIQRRGQGRGRRSPTIAATNGANGGNAEDLYAVLGVEPTADGKTLKTAYRKLALKYHPDVNKAADAEERFLSIKKAYSTLSDPSARREYDRLRSSGARAGFGGGGGDAGAGGFGTGFGAGFGAYSGRSSAGDDDDEEFYGLEDFFRDIEAEWKSKHKDGKPMSLWEELNMLGEEFVDFLEMSLEETVGKVEDLGETDWRQAFDRDSAERQSDARASGTGGRAPGSGGAKKEETVDDMLAKLKREMGL